MVWVKFMRSMKFSMFYNLIIFLLVLIGTIFMMTGFQFMVNVKVLEASSYSAFRFFTVDSNILVGIASLILAIYEYLNIKHNVTIPSFAYILKYIGTSAVALTFFITLFWLTRFYKEQFYLLYVNTNLFFHLLVPLLAIISFILFEKIQLNKKVVYLSLIPVLLYGIYYVINILTHVVDGMIPYTYDFYGFAQGGMHTIVFVFAFILLLTYGISLIIYKLNQRG